MEQNREDCRKRLKTIPVLDFMGAMRIYESAAVD
jgi:hypothetical protein